MSRIYDIDYDKIIVQNLPIKYRKRRQFDWLFCLFQPLKETYNSFKKFRVDSLYRASHNGQVFSMENVFNDRFDHKKRRVFIDNSFQSSDTYLYDKAEDKDVYLGTEYIYPEGGNVAEVDFLIFFPNAIRPIDSESLISMESEINSLANYYKKASKRHKLVWID